MPFPSVAVRTLAVLGAALAPSLASAPASADDAPRPPPVLATTPAPAPGPSHDGSPQPAAVPDTSGSAATDIDVDATGEDLPQPFKIGPQAAWFLLGGVSSGYTAMGDTGGYVGGEISLARLVSGRTVGLYADAYYDFGADGTYASFGPELGWKLFALDGGVAGRFAEDNDLGATGRLCVGVGLFSLCGRYSHFFDAKGAEDVLQFGALLKLPLISPTGGYR